MHIKQVHHFGAKCHFAFRHLILVQNSPNKLDKLNLLIIIILDIFFSGPDQS